MRWIAYNMLFVTGFLVLLPRFLLRMARRGGYARGFAQRFGCYDPATRRRLSDGRRVWIQAVSVGEVYVALGLMAEVRRRRPEARFVLSVTTSTGHAVARDQLPPEDVLVYFPVDFPPFVRRVLNRIRPLALVLVECELWPNLLRHAHRRGLPVALVNGRISEHSYRGYRKLRAFTRPLLADADLLCVQSEADAARLRDLGAAPGRLHVMGSAKYEGLDHDPAAEQRARAVLQAAGIGPGRTVLLGGSTWPGEEEILLDLFRALRPEQPDLALLLAPRHAERAGEVAGVIAARGLRAVHRSAIAPDGDPPSAAAGEPAEVFLLDTTGELRHFYAAADLIFIGKSLTQHGGQNLIEAAWHGKPVLCGPNMENFPVVMDDFLRADAVRQVADAPALRAEITRLLADPGARAELGARAARLVHEKAGALRRTVDLLEKLWSQE